jgi:hypothetical protein
MPIPSSSKASAGTSSQAGPKPPSPCEDLRAALRRLVPAAFPRPDVAVRLAGEIQVAGSLCDIVALLAQTGRSGTLIVSSADATRALAIERGELLGASTTAAAERIGEVLYRSGEISRDDIDEALMIAGIDGRFFGEVLVSLGRVNENMLEALLTRQAEEIFYSALRVEDGTFCFVDERLGVPLTAGPRPAVLSVLMEAARRMDEMLVYRESVASARHVPSQLPPATEAELSTELATIRDLCNGERSVAEIGREVGLLEFEVTQALLELVTKGMIEVLGPRVRSGEDIVGVFNDVLIEVHRRCDKLRRGDDLRRALDRYVSSSPELSALMHDVIPHDDGSLDVNRLLRNAGTARREAVVRRVLGGYVDFAVFHAGSLLPVSVAAELPATMARILQPLAASDPPPPVSGLMNRIPIALSG